MDARVPHHKLGLKSTSLNTIYIEQLNRDMGTVSTYKLIELTQRKRRRWNPNLRSGHVSAFLRASFSVPGLFSAKCLREGSWFRD